ncbi:DUF4166 domain-containing protein [Niveispirillum cyanobacteriorum]|uniref:DUF4166 domain-containing protein n=1 Tax=Niveispirillum cyanobacteriorum TaxID=1612173 RepID=A0A2K9NJU8_9PROT|nr:DUF4166 domain-containing protein [Niveispirillum cyanobacteriorum]AUN32605.1 DUF4166 domain-containing protein [Niveispirillum cyanobacteriorum]GGE76778.1 hypothetical protein GCM10011317_37320 [Niveispirillum cyanobacteriorum]
MTTHDAPLFRRLLGPTMDLLPNPVRDVHDGQGRLELSGLAQIDVMPGLLPGLICALMGLPRPGRNVPVTVIFDRTPTVEHWHRRFGDRVYASKLTAGTGAETGLLVERMGMITNVFRVGATASALHLTVVCCRFMGMPMPGWLAPRCAVVERQEDGSFTFDIPIDLPWLGRLIHYRGGLASAKNRHDLV